MIRANFIPAHRARRSRATRILRAWGVALGCFTLLLSIVLPAGRFALAAPDEQTRSTRERIALRIDAAMAESAQIERSLVSFAQRIESAETAGNHPDYSLLLDALASVRGDEATYSRMALAISRPTPPATSAQPQPAPAPPAAARSAQVLTVTIIGTATGPARIYELAQRIEHFGIFAKVRVKSTRAGSALPNSALATTSFEIEAIASESPEGTP